MSIKLEAGQWYRDRDGKILTCVFISRDAGDSYPCLMEQWDGQVHWVKRDDDYYEHIPDCTGFDWEPPKPIELPSQWRLLTEGDVIESQDKWWNGCEWTTLLSGRSVVGENWSSRTHHLFARKIEPKYRPFANAEEFKPFRDKWWKYIDGGEVVWPPSCYSDDGYGDTDWDYCFVNQVFDDGTPFGVRVDE